MVVGCRFGSTKRDRLGGSEREPGGYVYYYAWITLSKARFTISKRWYRSNIYCPLHHSEHRILS